MLAGVYRHGLGLELMQRPIPRIGDGDVLLKVEACGVCGTDLRIVASGHRRIPVDAERILGHELSGVVADLGQQVAWPRVGMRVASAPNMGCGRCSACIRGQTQLCPEGTSLGVGMDGGFAEYMLIPASAVSQGNIAELEDHVGYEEAALVEPLSCCYHALTACRLTPGEDVLVFGAGPIGIMHMLLARIMGARRVIAAARHPERLTGFPEPVADHILDSSGQDFAPTVMALTDGAGVDVAIIAAPSGVAQSRALPLLALHGRVHFFGALPSGTEMTSINANLVHYRELIVTGTTGQTVADYRACLDLVSRGRIDLRPLVTGRFGLREIPAAFEYAREKVGLKAMVLPHAGGSPEPEHDT
jgi:threonine dehydrogenase-like Zn-dependent dehydrogenase